MTLLLRWTDTDVAAAHWVHLMNRPWRLLGLAALLSFTLPQLEKAQMSMPVQTVGAQDQVPPEQLPVPQRMSGIGNAHMQITATPEAQAWFDQGLNLIHDFWDYESARAFEQGVRMDPRCAMCYWGLYKAESFFHGTSQGYADQALAMAVRLERSVSKRERLYIDAAAAFEKDSKVGKVQEALTDQTQILRELVKRYPRDTQAQIWLGWSLEDQKEAVALLENVMRDDPVNSAANHYYIHELEASDHPEQAMHNVEILPSLAPASGHMVHMPGHIYYRVGDYEQAEKWFKVSLQIDEHYMTDQQIKPDYDWNYVHNLMYYVADLMEEGKLNQATEVSAKLTHARGQFDSTLYSFSARDSISRLDPKLPVALRTADWAQVIALLKTSQRPVRLPNLDYLAGALMDFAIGMRAVESNNFSEAEAVSKTLDAGLWEMTQQTKDTVGAENKNGSDAALPASPTIQVTPDAMLPPLLNTLSVMSLELRASVLTVTKRADEAKELFARAAKEEKALGYHEPPNYIRPEGETEGAALMAMGDWIDAKAAYERALVERPRSGFPLYGIALSSERSGDETVTIQAYKDFLSAWRNADPELPQVRHAQTYISAHPR
jgi:tetratricopeptide (TPR) repeat protein